MDAIARGASACQECLNAFDRTWDVNWSRNPLNPYNLSRAAGRVRELVAQQRYDVVHVHTPVAAFVTRYALRGLRRVGRPKVIYTAHGFHFHPGGHPVTNMLFLELERIAGSWTDFLVVINREDEEAAIRHRLLPKERIRYMPGIGVDTDKFRREVITQEEVVSVRTELGLSPMDELFVMVAEFNPGKRHRDALHALARLARPEVHLAFAGDGPLLEDMQRLARLLGLERQVHFLGFRYDIPALIRAARATVLPSEREGLPRSIMESLCLEVPVLGTNVRGIRDLLQPGCGLLVKVGDVNGLAQAMAWILDHPTEASEMGRLGRELMLNYDIRRVLTLHEEMYAEALESPL